MALSEPMTENNNTHEYGRPSTEETDDDFVTGSLYPLKTHRWFDHSEASE